LIEFIAFGDTRATYRCAGPPTRALQDTARRLTARSPFHSALQSIHETRERQRYKKVFPRRLFSLWTQYDEILFDQRAACFVWQICNRQTARHSL